MRGRKRAPSPSTKKGTVSRAKQRELPIGARVTIGELRKAGGCPAWGERVESSAPRWDWKHGTYAGGEDGARTKSARARLTAAELTAVQSAARQAGLTVASFLRSAALYVAARLDGDVRGDRIE